MSRIGYIDYGSHWISAIQPVLETLQERGYTIAGFIREQSIPKDIDILITTSNNSMPNITKNTKIVFIPHGLGEECWDPVMNRYSKVLLAGKRPWSPGISSNNWKIVGWAKSDVLFNPRSDRVEHTKKLMSNLPYEESVMCIPLPDDQGNKLQFLVDYFNARGINMVIPYREYRNEAMQYYKDYNHIIIPEIMNLYYFVPHIKTLVCSGFTSVGREFYITQIPAIHIGKGFEESINLSNPEKQFDLIFSKILEDPKLYLQPESITKQYIEINDGKVVERIIKEVENLE